MRGVIRRGGLYVLGLSDVCSIWARLAPRLTYGANDEAKLEEFIVRSKRNLDVTECPSSISFG